MLCVYSDVEIVVENKHDASLHSLVHVLHVDLVKINLSILSYMYSVIHTLLARGHKALIHTSSVRQTYFEQAILFTKLLHGW